MAADFFTKHFLFKHFCVLVFPLLEIDTWCWYRNAIWRSPVGFSNIILSYLGISIYANMFNITFSLSGQLRAE